MKRRNTYFPLSKPFILLTTFLLLFSLHTQAQTWTGATDDDWNKMSNWEPMTVPDGTINVIIDDVSPNPPPVINNGTTALAKKVSVNANAQLTINSGGTLTINGSVNNGIANRGTTINNGTIIISNVTTNGIYSLEGASFNNNGVISIDDTGRSGIINEDPNTEFSNSGSIIIGANQSISIHGIFNLFSAIFINEACGTIKIFDIITNTSAFTNNGAIFLETTEEHTVGDFTNNGLIGAFGSSFNGATNSEIIINSANVDCATNTVSPAFDLAAMPNFTIDGVFLDENAMQSGGTYDQSSNTFTLDDINILSYYVKITDNDNSCASYITKWKINLGPTFVYCPDDIIINSGTNCEAVATWTEPEAMDNCGAGLVAFTASAGDFSFTYEGTLNGHYYYKSNEVLEAPSSSAADQMATFAAAQAAAATLGGYIVTIDDAAENTFIHNISQSVNDGLIIGYTDEAVEGTFDWVGNCCGGSGTTYTNWRSGEPNDIGGEDYTRISTAGDWLDVPLHVAVKQFVIELNAPLSHPSANYLGSTHDSGDVFSAIDSETVTYTATSISGNTATCSFTVTVEQNAPPSIECPDDIIVDTQLDESFVAVDYAVSGLKDCTAAIPNQIQGIASGADFPIGITTNTFEVVDGDQRAECSFTVTVNIGYDLTIDGPFCNGCEDPQSGSALACIGGTNRIIQGIDVSNMTADFFVHSVDFNQESFGGAPSVTVSIFCGEAETVLYTPAHTPIYSQVYQTRDVDNGQCVSIAFDTPPLIDYECGTTIWIEFKTTGGNRCVGTPASCNGVNATGNVTYIQAPSCDVNTPTKFSNEGFTLDASFAITVSTPLRVEGNLSYCASDHATVLSAAGGDWTDYLWSNDATTPTIEVTAGTYAVTVTDADGATFASEVTVIENDNNLQAVCPDDPTIVNLNLDGNGTLAANALATNNSTVTCGTFMEMSPEIMFTCEDIGTQTVTLTASDAGGGSSEVTCNVTIQDLIAPEIACPQNMMVNTTPDQCGATVSFDVPEGTDNCDNPSTEQTSLLGDGDFFEVGETTVSYQVTDMANRTTDCSFSITVNDIVPPTVSDCFDQLYIIMGENCEVTLPDYRSLVTMEDNCSDAINFSYTQTPEPQSMPEVGQYDLLITATDPSNNSSACMVELNICPPNSLTITNVEMNELVGGNYSSIEEQLTDCMNIPYMISNLEIAGAAGERNAFVDLTFDMGDGATMDCIVVASETGGALAVQWLNFDAKSTPRYTVDLAWQVRTDETADFFSIERSVDGIHFETIGQVEIINNNINITRFKYEDKTPFRGDNYYRILQNQADGSVKGSPIRLVTMEGEDIALFPNPTNNRFQLILPEMNDKALPFQIFSIDGRLAFQGQLTAEQQRFEWAIQDLNMNSSGIYFIKIQMARGKVEILKLSVVE